MGKKKTSQGLGRSIIKDRFGGGRRKHTNDSFLHTSEVQDGYEWGRLNLQSVTEQSNLDDFLATAELAGTEFAAEKLNIKFVTPGIDEGLLSKEEQQQVKETQDKHRKFIKIPRRPDWDETTTPEELEQAERDSFLKWRRGLAQLQEVEGLILTPFEKNLEFWRQLWRVIERSDVVVQIVDARNPLLFRCEDLETYVKEVDQDKVNVVLVNKADLLTEKQREYWSSYFTNVGLQVAFWSAVEENKRQEMEAKGCSEEDSEENDEVNDDDEDYDNEDEHFSSGDELGGNPPVNDAENQVACPTEDSSKNLGLDSCVDCGSSGEAGYVCVNCKDKETEKDRDSPSPSQSTDMSTCARVTFADTLSTNTSDSDCANSNISQTVSQETENTNTDSDQKGFVSSRPVSNSSKLLNGDELLDLLKSLHSGRKVTEGQTTIGLVGYPNVGKSSTINALLHMKKVPVSATPGRTKHFQTLYVEPTLMLCDCPGLVMPTFVSTKAEMVISGILPVDQMRDCLPPVALVCHLIPRDTLEAIYGINIPAPMEGEDPDRVPTSHELLYTYGYMRGFMTPRGVPDEPRSARYILKDYLNGKLLYSHPPPGVSTEDYGSQQEPPEDRLIRVRERQEKEKEARSKMAPEKLMSEVDRTFFQKTSLKPHTKGVSKPSPGSTPGASPAGSVASSTTSLAGKPWKKHNNRNKKEKLRRIHGELDKHDYRY